MARKPCPPQITSIKCRQEKKKKTKEEGRETREHRNAAVGKWGKLEGNYRSSSGMTDVIRALIFRRIPRNCDYRFIEGRARTHARKINVRRRKWTIMTTKSVASIQPRYGLRDKGPLFLKDAKISRFLPPRTCIQHWPTFHINYCRFTKSDISCVPRALPLYVLAESRIQGVVPILWGRLRVESSSSRRW